MRRNGRSRNRKSPKSLQRPGGNPPVGRRRRSRPRRKNRRNGNAENEEQPRRVETVLRHGKRRYPAGQDGKEPHPDRENEKEETEPPEARAGAPHPRKT